MANVVEGWGQLAKSIFNIFMSSFRLPAHRMDKLHENDIKRAGLCWPPAPCSNSKNSRLRITFEFETILRKDRQVFMYFFTIEE